MRYIRPEVLTNTCALDTIKGSNPKFEQLEDHGNEGTIAAYEADE
jgi:hypothetical protein